MEYLYDSAGNLIGGPPSGTTYTYDAENHLTSAGGMNYAYDGDGKRVWKAPATNPTQPSRIYFYGSQSDSLQETDARGNMLNQFYSFYGMRLVRREPGWVDHYGLDRLGNTRFVYGYNGNWDRSDYYPFGGERVYFSRVGNPAVAF